MKIKRPDELTAFLGPKTHRAGEKIISERRIYNIKQNDLGYTAFVLDTAGIPLSLDIKIFETSISWSCPCGSLTPCEHISAFIISLYPESISISDKKLQMNRTPKIQENQRAEEKSNSSQQGLFGDLFATDDTVEDDQPITYTPFFKVVRRIFNGNRFIIQRWLIDEKRNLRPPGSTETIQFPNSATREIWEHIAAYPDEQPPLEDILHFFADNSIPLHKSKLQEIVLHKRTAFRISFTVESISSKGNNLYKPLFSRGRHEIPAEELGLTRNKELFYIVNGSDIFMSSPLENDATIKKLLTKTAPYTESEISALPEDAGENIKIILPKKDSASLSVEPKLICKVDPGENDLGLFFEAVYNEKQLSVLSGERFIQLAAGLAERNREKEQWLVNNVKQRFSEHIIFEKGHYSSGDSDIPDISIDLGLDEVLLEHAEYLLSKGISIKLNQLVIEINKSIQYRNSSGTDWFEVQAGTGSGDNFSPIEFDEAFYEYGIVKSGNAYVALKAKDIENLRFMLKQGMDKNGHLKSSSVNLSLVDAVYTDAENRDQFNEPHELFDKLQNQQGISHVPQPAGLQAKLRSYQQHGLNWLIFLHNAGLQGCLADDMGLGKTLQTLSLLQHLKENDDYSTCLLITPVVTLANWQAEMKRFTPDISIHRHAGPGRHSELQELLKYDVVVMSYHTLRNDLALFLEHDFFYIILDEAHYIKNASSQTFKAIRSLKSKHRLSLTGTPLENNTMELWSQMTFLNPGLLGSQQHFRHQFALPIEKQGDSEASAFLRKIIFPFILRRKKEDVLDELPPKEEIVHYLEMTPQQAGIYNEYKEMYKQRVMGLFNQEKKQGSSLEVLQFILKLRQIAIHPPIAEPDLGEIPSGKLEGLEMLLDEILSEDHKVLIFSQFVSTLNAISNFCSSKNWKHAMLTGSTKDREAEVERFKQEEDCRIFLLSLKAGGVGINLTNADYVIMFDPWWNPAAEAQAVDRAYRMGQKRKVFAYKLIMKDTIEEKILEMQNRKKELIGELITEDASVYKNMSQKEILDLFN